MKKILSIFLLCVIIISALGFIGCEKKDKLSINNKEKVKSIVLPNEKDNSIELDLYFDSTSDNKAETAKEERIINKEELLGEIIIQELLKGPSNVSKLKPILPKETRLLSFSVKDSIAYINLSSEAKVAMSEAKEKACLTSIVTSLAQLPSITKVKIMVDNKDIDSLGGNYDISKPFTKEDIQFMLKK
ncbi:GerMN domain-containing protein [Clostridium sp. SYSU_GA19001]|uniref:GerMN domain-containing protein n=1 Tax=Clostridium caldaquaticum TaxID=2940653 RepID=UPI0020777899|nr:GerMN domain-containing protein [Clostridium caldaquaticum]MCM8709629.1 GerMN domain-containing protein [Clostridium caldaquaticum]